MALMQPRGGTQPLQIVGVILAGGRGLRMGGCEKALLPFRAQTLLGHIIERLTPQVDQLLINANRELSSYQNYGFEVICDQNPSINQGPMAGIEAAMTYTHSLKPNHDRWLLTVPCDGPLLPLDLAKRLLRAAIESHLPAAVAWDGTRIHPTFCLLHTSLHPTLSTALAQGGLKLGQWLRDIPAAHADFSDQVEAFINFNTPEQLAADQSATRSMTQ